MTALVPDELLEKNGLERGEDGVCSHFKNNECEIYEDRPAICDVEVMMLNRKERIGYQAARHVANICNILMGGEHADLAGNQLITEDMLRKAYPVGR